MDAKDKDYLISRMRKEKNNPKEVYDLGDLEWFPTDEEREQKAPKECQDEKKIATVNKILEDFKNGNSKINKDLKEILGNVDLVIAIRPPDQWKNPNGGMVFKRGENGENDKAVLFVADVMFTEAHKDKLPGLLAHEMGHLLEFKQRPNDDSVKTKYMDGAESFADVSGEMIARNAGHTSMPWAMFMRQSSKNGNDPEHSPSGQYRAKTIMRTIRAFNKTESKKKQNISERISSLRNRISKCDTKAPNKTNQNISKVDFSTLKMYQEKKTNS